MRAPVRWLLWSCLSASQVAPAQTVVGNEESVATDSPEAWAMRYFAATSLMTSFGETPGLAPWRWNVAGDLGTIPQLSDAQQRVGFGGFKNEDLNKSPVFGRLRLALGLPFGWVAELGYTPPLEIDGARPRNIVALAIGRRLFDSGAFTFSMRALGQLGQVQGDITCPAQLAGIADPLRNPYGCQSPSKDRFTTDYYGLDATVGWNTGNWKWHASAGVVQTDLAVQIDAQVFTTNDRSRLTSNGRLAWYTLGTRYVFDSRWSVAAELLYVPLDVRRPPDFAVESDPLTSARVQLRYSVD